ncbi:hypothetical protein DPEC_G00026470 [Dallia pectoralis]|uniref:Uncharacterized protein n=1 Tax=Dallia pectoralis TaxID=75939 RepID=A0ACC2HIC1_DALPE|nr:hypothetical protein DPEC_G00026470 [Dallia pectoralis]
MANGRWNCKEMSDEMSSERHATASGRIKNSARIAQCTPTPEASVHSQHLDITGTVAARVSLLEQRRRERDIINVGEATRYERRRHVIHGSQRVADATAVARGDEYLHVTGVAP